MNAHGALSDRIAADGFVILPGLLADDQRRAALRALDEVFDREADIADVRRWRTDAYRVAYMLPAKHRTFLELWDQPELMALAATVLGDDFVLAGLNGMSMNPRGPGQPLHRDHPVTTAGVTLYLNVVCALDEFTVQNGATRVVAGSHRVDTPDALQITSAERAELEAAAKPLTIPAGDAVVFDATIWHAASANTTDAPRRALHLFFCRRWVQPHWDFPGSLPAEWAAELSPRQRAVLGFGNTAARYDHEQRRAFGYGWG